MMNSSRPRKPESTAGQKLDSSKSSPEQKEDPSRSTPEQKDDPSRLTPEQKEDPSRLTPEQIVDPSRLTPEQKEDPSRSTSEQKVDPSRSTPEQKEDPSRSTPEQKENPSRLTPEQKEDPSRSTPEQKVDPSRSTPEQKEDPSRSTPEQKEDPSRSTPEHKVNPSISTPEQKVKKSADRKHPGGSQHRNERRSPVVANGSRTNTVTETTNNTKDKRKPVEVLNDNSNEVLLSNSASPPKDSNPSPTSSDTTINTAGHMTNMAKEAIKQIVNEELKPVIDELGENKKAGATDTEGDTAAPKDNTTAVTETAKPETEPTLEEDKYERLRNVSDEEALALLKVCIDELKQLEVYDKGTTMPIMMLVSDIYFDYEHIRPALEDTLLKEGFIAHSVTIIKEFNRLGIFKTDDIWFQTEYIYSCWCNYSDASDTLAEALADNNVVMLLTMNCKHGPYLETYNTSTDVFCVLESSLTILHNIARIGTVKHYFDENKTPEALVPFLSQEDEMLKILANLTIAHIQDEDTNKKQILGPETIECIIKWTDSALQSSEQRYRGFSPFELIDGLNKLAVNDSNKMTIVDKGAIPVLTKLLTDEDVVGQACASRMIWTLSFDKNVREKIKEDPQIMELLEKLKSSQESRVKKNVSGALWVIKGENDITDQKRPKSTTTQGHVMLSYSWSDKEMVLKIKEQLQAAGYPIWIDIERMGGSTLEAMAEAIEQASVVLMCMSEKYKNSPNCRTEAEYTFQLRKNYVPLMMQKKYKPDGWLGIILGVKLFFEFNGKYPFEKTFSGLLRELRSKTKAIPSETAHTSHDNPDGAVVASTAQKTFAPLSRRQSTLTSVKFSVLSMGQPEVSTWLQNEAKLTTCLNQFQKFKIDGKLLTQLIVMRTEAPEFFYQCLERRLNMDLTEILQFTSALDDLGT